MCTVAVYSWRKVSVLLLVLSVSVSAGLFAQDQKTNVLIIGGGSAHDFAKWYGEKDLETLKKAGINAVYTDDPGRIRSALKKIDVLLLANNKAIPGTKTRKAIFEFVQQGGGLVLSHAATWYNWNDWSAFNRQLVAGGARGHVHTSPFEVEISNSDHPILRGVSSSFKITDELYRYKKDDKGPSINVLGKGTHHKKNETHAVLWTVQAFDGRIVCNTLGHDGRAHKHPEYKQLLVNSIGWAARTNTDQ